VNRNNWLCLDCDKDTFKDNEDYYFLRNRLWRSLVPREERHGMLCRACVERRLGRPLAPEDFLTSATDDASDPEDRPMQREDYGINDDFITHRLTGKWALSPDSRAWVARIILFLRSGQAYRYPPLTGFRALPVLLVSLVTLGWFGRFWVRHKWSLGDQAVWPFFSRADYEQALAHPVYLNRRTFV
jgi:hypothetical protein